MVDPRHLTARLLGTRSVHVALSVAASVVCGCADVSDEPIVRIGGSSTVYPLSEAVAEDFGGGNRVRVTVASGGTGTGMRRLCEGELDIAGASRAIKASEVERCARHGRAVIELPVGWDGIVIAVNPAADWVDSITIDELRRMWEPAAQGQIVRWNQIRPEWPDAPLRLYGAGVDSGTYDYFTRAVVGVEHSSRGDFTSSEDDNVLVQGVAQDPHALGFFGYAYWHENAEALKAVAIDDQDPTNGTAPVLPSAAAIQSGIYTPLSRPLLVYVAEDAARRSGVTEVMEFYLDQGARLAEDVGAVGLSEQTRALVHARFAQRVTGSLWATEPPAGATLNDLLAVGNP